MALDRSLVLALVCALACAAPAAAKPRLLITGDSMIEPVAAQAERGIERKRGEARVIRDVHAGTGITKPWRRNWVDYSRHQMRRHRPRATVVMIGANDGFPLLDDRGREVACCRRAWIEAYARDAARMMKAYSSRGRHAYWLNLPAPDDEQRYKIYAAVNIALGRAARRFERVRLLDMVKLFTPGYRYRRRMTVKGRRVAVRERDGVHLNSKGAALALRAVRRALRSDRVIR